MLTIEGAHKFRIVLYVYNHRTNSDVSQVLQGYATRGRQAVVPSYERLTFAQKSVRHSGPIMWNSIPESVKAVKSKSSFKKQFMIFIVSNQLQPPT